MPPSETTPLLETRRPASVVSNTDTDTDTDSDDRKTMYTPTSSEYDGLFNPDLLYDTFFLQHGQSGNDSMATHQASHDVDLNYISPSDDEMPADPRSVMSKDTTPDDLITSESTQDAPCLAWYVKPYTMMQNLPARPAAYYSYFDEDEDKYDVFSFSWSTCLGFGSWNAQNECLAQSERTGSVASDESSGQPYCRHLMIWGGENVFKPPPQQARHTIFDGHGAGRQKPGRAHEC
ncbi:hypothetical protein F66182_8009 [Fusarium sp. NRRL 66182]|nr:hypothetical protein F66182_8009 [Fusarium sp. NRRL 66182]